MTAGLPPLPVGFSPVPDGHLAAVVTHLEMTTRPAPRAVPPLAMPLATPLTLERLRGDAPGALDVYRSLFRAVGEAWLWFSRLRLSDAALAAILDDPAVEVYVVCDGEARVGLLELDFREPGACELAFLGLTAAYTGQGAGRWLMHEAIMRAWARDITRFHVHTCTLDHPGAVAFYVRSGFTPYKREVEIAPDPRLTGELAPHVAPHAPLIARDADAVASGT